MTNYTKWLIRSRIIIFTGAALLIGPTIDGFEFDFENSLKVLLHILGLVVFVIGLLDCLGLINRKFVKAAIREENERMRS